MSEISSLVGLYGAIDDAVQGDVNEDRRRRASNILMAYRHPETRWFDVFRDWTREKRQEEGPPPFPESLIEALSELGQFAPAGRMRARRIMAIAAAAQVFPEIGDIETDPGRAALEALRFNTLINDRERAVELLKLITTDAPGIDERERPGLDLWWSRLITRGHELGLLPSIEEIGPRPCTATLEREPHEDRFVTVIKTEFETSRLQFAQACGFLNPAIWPACNDFWCTMEDRGPLVAGGRWFHEEVSLDCENAASTWGIAAELSFRTQIDPDLAVAEYEVAGDPAPDSPDVVVDSGSLQVERIDADTLRVSTTKRVLFSVDFPGEGLALVICVLGYGEIAEDFVYAGAGTGPAQKTAAPDGSALEDVIDRAAAAAKTSIDECAAAARASYDKVMDRSYDADALAQDLRGAFDRMLRDGAKAADLLLEGATAVRERARR